MLDKHAQSPPEEIINRIVNENGHFPNNPELPFLLYKKSLKISSSKELDQLFKDNGWRGNRREGIYTYHFRSHVHETIAIYDGSCSIQIGGPGGFIYNLEKGDVLIIPAGVSHKNLGCTKDFKCVGAYFHSKAASLTLSRLPKTDPIYGSKGFLFNYWK